MDKRKIANYIAHGVSNRQIALATGKTEGYISQLISDDIELREHIAEVAVARSEQDTLKDLTLEQIEAGLMRKAKDMVEGSETLGEVIRALKDITMIKAQRKINGIDREDKGVLSIPLEHIKALQLNIITNSAGEIEAINNKSMAPMPTAKVLKLVDPGKNLQEAISGM